MKSDPVMRMRSHLFTGLLLVVVGIAFLLSNFEVVSFHGLWRYWPLILVVMGVGQFVLSVGTPSFPDGVWLALIGLWLFVSVEHLWGLSFHNSWPILIVAWGIQMVARAFVRLNGKEDVHGES